MLVPGRMPQRRRRSPGRAVAMGPVLVVALSVALVPALASCSSGPRPGRPSTGPSTGPTTGSTTGPTPLADYDTSDLTLARAGFCDRVVDDAIAAALTGEATDQDAWRPGSRLPESKDISNEFGCSWSSGSARATAWVFAPPVTSERAVDFADEVIDKSCRRLRDAPDLGGPSVAQKCGSPTGRTGIYGLVGDAWVGCEISDQTSPSWGDVDLVGEWCVAVLEAMRAS